VKTSPGAGPRHFAFHPNGNWFYLLNEESSTLTLYLYNAAAGTLTEQQTVSTLPPGFAGTNFTSEIMVSADGRFVYCANRLHDTIAFFLIDRTGAVTLIDETSTLGDYPRNFNIDPTGGFMYTCNQCSDHIATFRMEGNGIRSTFADQYTPVGSPAIILFLT
jgi:6-phosphogluconolactonase (cycloisomerase 2 family)